MSEETVINEQLTVNRNQLEPPETAGEAFQDRSASEKEITALKEKHAAEIAALTEQVQALRDAVKENLSAASGPPAGLDSPPKTAGVKEPRGSARSALATAASQAHQTGSRTDVQEYLRLRRQYV